jgi:hypothetical protein
MVVLLAMIAFAVDIGYVSLVRAELQNAADSAAMAASSTLGRAGVSSYDVAQHYASKHVAGGQAVSLASSEVEPGNWDVATATFTPAATGGNAVRVTARRDNAGLFFARVLGQEDFDVSASAISMATPRDIVFVVDLSGSMNDDSEPCWATYYLTEELAPLGYATAASDLMQQLYTDFGYGTFPGTLQWMGAPAGLAADSPAYQNLTANGGPLTLSGVSSTYKINSGDNESTRKTKAYKWMIDNQIAAVMPSVKPTASSSNTTSFNYWVKYLDYVIAPKSAGSRGTLPPNQDSDRISGLNNPNTASFPDASASVPQGYRNQIGYRTYVQFMMDFGRNVQPDGTTYTPLSTLSADCPWHTESTDGGTFYFPPREQPTHASRRALIAAIQVVKERNEDIPDPTQRDWVSIVSFDVASPGPTVRQALTGEYDDAMLACASMQAVADNQYSTSTEAGLITAQDHVASNGRSHAEKVVVLLTDGMPNLYTSSTSTISDYRDNNPHDDFYGGGSYALDAPLMQTRIMQLQDWRVFPVGLGLGTDYSFMDRMARMSFTDNSDGQSPRGSGNPAEYEQRLVDIFEEIITNPRPRLVK